MYFLCSPRYRDFQKYFGTFTFIEFLVQGFYFDSLFCYRVVGSFRRTSSQVFHHFACGFIYYYCAKLLVCKFSLLNDQEGLKGLQLQSVCLSGHPFYCHGSGINKQLISALVHTPQCLGVFCERVCGMRWLWHTQQHMGRTAQTAATDESES